MNFPGTVLSKGSPGTPRESSPRSHSGQWPWSPSCALPAHQLHHEPGKPLEQRLRRRWTSALCAAPAADGGARLRPTWPWPSAPDVKARVSCHTQGTLLSPSAAQNLAPRPPISLGSPPLSSIPRKFWHTRSPTIRPAIPSEHVPSKMSLFVIASHQMLSAVPHCHCSSLTHHGDRPVSSLRAPDTGSTASVPGGRQPWVPHHEGHGDSG